MQNKSEKEEYQGQNRIVRVSEEVHHHHYYYIQDSQNAITHPHFCEEHMK